MPTFKRLNSLERSHRSGQLPDKDYRQEKNRISAAVLSTLEALHLP